MIEPSYDNSDGRQFPSLDMDGCDAATKFAEYHAQVVRRNHRVEVICHGESCVLISKIELESLERALEILSNTDAVQAMRDQIALTAALASSAGSPAVPNLQSALPLR